jgi:hypothetical protein
MATTTKLTMAAWATEGSAKEKEIHERITDVKTR